MKKSLLLLVMLLCSIGQGVAQFSIFIDGIYYHFSSSSTVSVTSVPNEKYKYSGSISIPCTVVYNGTTYSVTGIGYEAFRDCSGLTSIEIPNSVTIIGEGAFSNCSGLTSIRIPNSVTSIRGRVFSHCTGLTSIEIPNSVTSIEIAAFSYCSGLTSIAIPNSVTSIGYHAFEYCSGLTSIEIPSSVTSIGNYAFSYCSGLTSLVVDAGNAYYDSRNNCNAIIETSSNVLSTGCKNTVIPNSISSIGDYAFEGCTDLTSIEIPNSVTSIGDDAFYCSGLTSIEIPNSVTSIGKSVFNGCSSLTSIKIPNSVTGIGESAFSYCSSLNSIEIPNSVTSIGDYAFSGCSGLNSIEIPNSVTSIGDYAFRGCSSLTYTRMMSSTPPTTKKNSLFYECEILTTIYVPKGARKAYSISPWNSYRIREFDVTGIAAAPTADNQTVAAPVYDLNGRCVGTTNAISTLPKVVYIVNGKKILR